MNGATNTSAKRLTNREGFTLIELMVVIVILGLLMAVVVPRMIGATDDAKVRAAQTQIHSFRTALDMFKLKFGRYPGTSEGLQALVSNEKQNFLNEDNVPSDPWGNPYQYTCPGTKGHDFEVVSFGADGAPGGTEYNTDIESWNLQAQK
ncbi:MAG: type II secretion system major pseudopilin GspG [Candidatus Hydrogenedentes bacterium]|nr:type II secretion system major pseudopilin GspG [Candidatus Hydrogenedentota bacterium]